MTYSNNASVSGNVEAFWSSCSRADGESINCISLVTASWNDNQQRTCVFGSCSHVAAGSVCQVSGEFMKNNRSFVKFTRKNDNMQKVEKNTFKLHMSMCLFCFKNNSNVSLEIHAM